PALAELLAAFRDGARKGQARGLFGAARGYALIRLAEDSKRPLVCVEPDEEAAEALERDLRFFARDRAVVRIPGDEVLPYEGLTPDRFVAQQRLAALFRLHLGERPIVVCSIKSVGRRVLPRAALDRRSLQISLEMEQDRDELARRLTAAGYARVPLVEDPGTFAIRGGVFDVWSPLHSQPSRLEFFGDLVEKIRSFDPQTQRTSGHLKEISLCPAREIALDEGGRWRASEEPFAQAGRKGEPGRPPAPPRVHARALRRAVEAAPVRELSGLVTGAGAAVGGAEIDFDLQRSRELRAETQSHHGEDG